jgi:hypothetical protein
MENLKEELEKIGYANLFVEHGQSVDYVDRIKRKFNISRDVAIIGFIDGTYEKTGEEGVLITEEGIRWFYSQVKIDEKEQKTGSLTFPQLTNYSSLAKTKFIRNGITLKKRNIGDGKNLVIEMAFLYNAGLGDKVNEEQVHALEKIFSVLSSVSAVENTVIPDEKNGELIDVFIGDDQALFYKKAFGRYSVNGIDKFGFCFSWGGFLFSAINLFHRKLYKEGVIWLIGEAVLSVISNGFLSILVFLVSAFANPYLVYKRYKKIILQCDSQKMSYDQKLETLRILGGTNTVTTVIAGLLALIGFIIFIRSAF